MSIEKTGPAPAGAAPAANIFTVKQIIDERNEAHDMIRKLETIIAELEEKLEEASAPQAVRMPLTEAVFLNLLGQVNAFVAEQGEANFYTGPARALQRWLSGKTLAPHEREAIDKFAAAHGIVPLAPQGEAR